MSDNTETSDALVTMDQVKPEDISSQMLSSVMANFMKWYPRYNEFAQGRTPFQIEKYVAMEETTPAECYANTLFQTRSMRAELLREVKEAIDMMRLHTLKWDGKDKNQPLEWGTKDGMPNYIWFDTDD